MNYYLAIDIGASSGRHILGSLENGQLNLEEIYRFENGMKKKEGHLVWDTKYLFHEIHEGIKKCKKTNQQIPEQIGEIATVIYGGTTNLVMKCERCKRILDIKKFTQDMIVSNAKDGIFKI